MVVLWYEVVWYGVLGCGVVWCGVVIETNGVVWCTARAYILRAYLYAVEQLTRGTLTYTLHMGQTIKGN